MNRPYGMNGPWVPAVEVEMLLVLIRDLMIHPASVGFIINHGDAGLCPWCREGGYVNQVWTVVHLPDCAWLRAKAIVDKVAQ